MYRKEEIEMRRKFKIEKTRELTNLKKEDKWQEKPKM